MMKYFTFVENDAAKENVYYIKGISGLQIIIYNILVFQRLA